MIRMPDKIAKAGDDLKNIFLANELRQSRLF